MTPDTISQAAREALQKSRRALDMVRQHETAMARLEKDAHDAVVVAHLSVVATLATLARLDAALASEGEAEPVAIKPLVWDEPNGRNNMCWVGTGALHRKVRHHYSEGYSISHEDGRYWLGVDDGRPGEEQHLGAFDSLKEAQNEAEADYEHRIRCCLTPPAKEPEAASRLSSDAQAEMAKAVAAEREACLAAIHDAMVSCDCTGKHMDWVVGFEDGINRAEQVFTAAIRRRNRTDGEQP